MIKQHDFILSGSLVSVGEIKQSQTEIKCFYGKFNTRNVGELFLFSVQRHLTYCTVILIYRNIHKNIYILRSSWMFLK